MDKAKILLRPDILEGLYEYAKGAEGEVSTSSSFCKTLTLSFEEKDIFALISEGENSVKIIIKGESELASLRLTKIKAKYGQKMYIDYGPGVTEAYLKRRIKELAMFTASCYQLLCYTHSKRNEENFPFAVIEGTDSSGETVIIFKYFKEEKGGSGLSMPKKEISWHKVKGHYRKLPNGKMVWVKAHEKGKKK